MQPPSEKAREARRRPNQGPLRMTLALASLLVNLWHGRLYRHKSSINMTRLLRLSRPSRSPSRSCTRFPRPDSRLWEDAPEPPAWTRHAKRCCISRLYPWAGRKFDVRRKNAGTAQPDRHMGDVDPGDRSALWTWLRFPRRHSFASR
jgi:hypothetical protein